MASSAGTCGQGHEVCARGVARDGELCMWCGRGRKCAHVVWKGTEKISIDCNTDLLERKGVRMGGRELQGRQARERWDLGRAVKGCQGGKDETATSGLVVS